jgi:predicted tellurium resistance membrane protein TerC
MFTIPDFSSPELWVGLLALTFLEIVLGIDNIIFVSIVANRLPRAQQSRARNIGLMMAMGFRLLLLLVIGWILSLDKPVINLPFESHGEPIGLSIKDLILVGGGLFLLYKSTVEIHHKLEGKAEHAAGKAAATMSAVVMQIVLVNIVFSFDSILTAIGMTKEVLVMMIAVVVSIGFMMMFSGPISHFINTHPTMQMLALSFLVLIGVLLVAEGFHQHVSKGYVYFAIAFSMGVELLNLRMRRKSAALIQLHGTLEEGHEQGIVK